VPIIAGLYPKTSEPFLSVMDLIGQPCSSSDFAVIGCASEQLYGMCEALWRPNLVRNNLKLEISLIINK
jgi:20S proteasome subunit beta 3